LESYRKLAGISKPLTDQKRLDLNTIRTNAKDAYQCYKTFTGRQAEKARQDWMEGLINEQQRKKNEDRYRQSPNEGSSSKGEKANQKTTKSNGRHTKANGTLRERESVMYRRMHHAALKPQRLSTSMVIAPHEDKEWTERTTKQDMEKAIVEHHVKKYSLSHITHLRCVYQYNGNSILTASLQLDRAYWMVLICPRHRPIQSTALKTAPTESDKRDTHWHEHPVIH
jgi:hypothetical protein